jgi:hypothetical protein
MSKRYGLFCSSEGISLNASDNLTGQDKLGPGADERIKQNGIIHKKKPRKPSKYKVFGVSMVCLPGLEPGASGLGVWCTAYSLSMICDFLFHFIRCKVIFSLKNLPKSTLNIVF